MAQLSVIKKRDQKTVKNYQAQVVLGHLHSDALCCVLLPGSHNDIFFNYKVVFQLNCLSNFSLFFFVYDGSSWT
jgi:hypothetical protein